MELIVHQGVENKLTDQLARILLSINKITKEEKLLGLLLAEVDDEGVVEVINGSRDKLCMLSGITKEMYASYLSKWKNIGIVEKSGKFLRFKKYIHPGTKYIAITCNINGMVCKIVQDDSGME